MINNQMTTCILYRRVLLFSLYLYLPICNAYSTGAPDSRCISQVPGHWVSAQTTPSPFLIQISHDTVQEGGFLYVNLTGARDQPGFKGFLIQVKRPGKEEDAQNFGSFDIFKSDGFQSQPLHCFGNSNSGMTHKDSVAKHFVSLVWITPKLEHDENEAFYEIRVTFVQNFWTIYPNQTPEKLIRVIKRDETVSVVDDNKESGNFFNQTSTLSSILTSSTPQSHHSLLIPQVRDADTVFIPSSNKTTNAYGYMEGSWNYFKTSWMNFLHYFRS